MQSHRCITLALLVCTSLLFQSNLASANGLSDSVVLRNLWSHSALLQSELGQGDVQALLSQKVSAEGCGDIEKYYEPAYRVEWVTLNKDSGRVDFRLCPTDEVIHIHGYQYDDDRTLYSIALESGVGHETWSYEFWVSSEDRSFLKASEKEVGIILPLNKDFLTSRKVLPKDFNHGVKLYFDETNGDFIVEPDLTQPEWNGIQPDFRFRYIWNGKQFAIKKVPLKSQNSIQREN